MKGNGVDTSKETPKQAVLALAEDIRKSRNGKPLRKLDVFYHFVDIVEAGSGPRTSDAVKWLLPYNSNWVPESQRKRINELLRGLLATAPGGKALAPFASYIFDTRAREITMRDLRNHAANIEASLKKKNRRD